MSEGVQTSPVSSGGDSHRLSGALVPIIIGVVAALSSWTTDSNNMGGLILLVVGCALAILGGAMMVMRITVRGPRDYFGGLALVAIALFAIWASSNLQGMTVFAFGPGTAPRLFAGALVALGLAVAAVGCFDDGPGLEAWAIRGPFFITLSTIIFALTIRHVGLVITSFVSICIAAAGSRESRVVETIIWGAVLTVFCAVLFPYVLNLPMPLWPQNLRLDNVFSIR